ncbi:hypothetical protein [Streptomyces orinoci]|uniref:Uncharacterized protein n=1 Tax=Streptomyces orinoci TaxID=67339 RepID=A0ABV3JQG6_STRON|nr:hypothetical protein [Streptomyces orinoci]
MTPESTATAQAAATLLAGKRKADDAAFMLERALAELGIRVGDPDSWPQLTGRASLSGEPAVFLGTVPLPTIRKLIDTLVHARSEQHKRDQRALGHDC